jgi:ankyrin repeat protein
MKGRQDIVTLLIEKCKDAVNQLTYSSETLIHLAVKAKRSEIVEFFTAQGVTQLMLNKKDCNGNTVLHIVVAGRQKNVRNHLLLLVLTS